MDFERFVETNFRYQSYNNKGRNHMYALVKLHASVYNLKTLDDDLERVANALPGFDADLYRLIAFAKSMDAFCAIASEFRVRLIMKEVQSFSPESPLNTSTMYCPLNWEAMSDWLSRLDSIALKYEEDIYFSPDDTKDILTSTLQSMFNMFIMLVSYYHIKKEEVCKYSLERRGVPYQ